MTFVDLIIERHSCDQALQRAVAEFNGRRYRRAIAIFQALYHPELKDCAQFSEVLQFYLIESNVALAKQALHRRRYAESILHYRAAVKLAPAYADLHFTLGKIHVLQGKFAAARAEFARALKINPRYQDARVQLGLTLFRLRRPAAALRLFVDLAADCSLVNQERFDSAMAAADRRQYRRAAALFGAAFTARPDRSRALCAMGQDAYREHRYERAIAHFANALKLSPNYADVYNHLGACYSQQGRWARAVRQFELAIKLAPRFTRAWLNLAYTCERQGDRDRALWAARNALRLNNGNKLAQEIVQRLTTGQRS
ncbi:MAG TPA: tetratricopeptide repeat protein [Candidatus Edwardsbacteria bacterium]|nr:tetratricopeptide repeat protein [Candidatus Edwardsbacteria bacterium]